MLSPSSLRMVNWDSHLFSSDSPFSEVGVSRSAATSIGLRPLDDEGTSRCRLAGLVDSTSATGFGCIALNCCNMVNNSAVGRMEATGP